MHSDDDHIRALQGPWILTNGNNRTHCPVILRVLVIATFPEFLVQAFLISTGVVALAEIGDKTQLLALVLAARFRRPLPVIAGILIATMLNHGVAGFAGTLAGALLAGPWMRWILGLSFLAMAGWALVPDKLDDGMPTAAKRHGAFLTTLIAFFLVEIGDKTQIATVALAAQFEALVPVVIGTTLGMLLANVPVILVGGAAADRLPLKLIRAIAAAIFAVLGVLILAGVGTT
jgi:putative Ca2+/H+ antiporter (TMEM165/GDT1 family)